MERFMRGIRRERVILNHNSRSTQHGKDVTKVSVRYLTDAYNMKILQETLPWQQTDELFERRLHVIVHNSVEVFLRWIIEETGLDRETFTVDMNLDGKKVMVTSTYDDTVDIVLTVNMHKDMPDSLTIEKCVVGNNDITKKLNTN